MKLLVVDDEPNVLYSFEKGLSQGHQNLQVLTTETGKDAIRLVKTEKPDAVVLDVRLTDMSGLEVFDSIRDFDCRIPVILVTAYSTTETAINAMKRGAFDYLLKPVDIHQLRNLINNALEVSRLQHIPALFEIENENTESDLIVGRSDTMQDIYKTIGRIASENVTVLILGESGTGKELVARSIFHHSQRNNKPFLAINCAALPESLLESELFGHERGAFTGADRSRIGKFEQAQGGTLFLDEVGDMSLATQAKVLRVLQDGCFERVGGNESIQTDVRIIAATNQDLDNKIAENQFRLDLLYRLNAFTVRMPPLRERIADLPLLIEHLLVKCNQQFNKQIKLISSEAMDLLNTYNWPGNVRELQSVIQYAVIHAVGEVITPDCLPESCRSVATLDDDSESLNKAFAGLSPSIQRLLNSDEPDLYRILQTELDRVMLREVLQYFHGNQVHASQRLGMSRTTLRTKLASLGLNQETSSGCGIPQD
ncbi:Nitrogen regulation protein NR(I) [Gimesia panareensis]|uniref:DNA-binding transcriptional regulator NtrC n=1 Tax=Gimesia panareensis TaxID=2527978 RepID=A0A518FWF1_9PLAN|nr:sigma-54 dependent transcriptional regulator [Gimesia panareensis]QDV20566.1 Nitrogen regulation protein NR(I) [Gimesia panareensis]